MLAGIASQPTRPTPQYFPTWDGTPRFQPITGGFDSSLPTQLEGCVIVADDGQSLGVITANKFSENSILNDFGDYGSKFSGRSIFNDFGNYGGKFSELSPFNEFSTRPPRIIASDGRFIGYLTTNRFLSPRFDPHALIGLMRMSQ